MTKRSNLAETQRKERDRLSREADRQRAREEDASLEAHMAEVVHLGSVRGEEFTNPSRKPGEARKPIRRISPLAQMLANGTLSPRQYEAGKLYGDLMRRLEPKSPRSCLNDSVGGGLSPTEARARDLSELSDIWKLLDHDARKIRLIDRLCGNDETLSCIAKNDSKQREVLYNRLVRTLDELADYYRVAG